MLKAFTRRLAGIGLSGLLGMLRIELGARDPARVAGSGRRGPPVP